MNFDAMFDTWIEIRGRKVLEDTQKYFKTTAEDKHSDFLNIDENIKISLELSDADFLTEDDENDNANEDEDDEETCFSSQYPQVGHV